MYDPVRNLLSVTVSAGYDFAATTIGLNPGDGARLPNPATEGAFNALYWNQGTYPNPENDANVEIIRVNTVTDNELGITRAQEGTSASNKNTVGGTYKLSIVFSKKSHDDIIHGITSLTIALTSISGNIQSLSSTVITFPDGSKFITAVIPSGVNISASTENYLVRYSSNSGLTNSLITDDGIKISTISAFINSLTANRIVFSDGTHLTTGIPDPPIAPTLNFPVNSSTQTDRNLLFSWQPAARATSYTLQVATDANFGGLFYNQSNLSTTAQQVNGMTNNTIYYWRVNGSNSGGTGAYSTTSNYTTYILLPPILNSPTGSITGVVTTPTLNWTPAVSATTYAYDVSISSNFATTASSSANISTTAIQVAGLLNNQNYYWRVRSSNAGGQSNNSLTANFVTIPAVFVYDIWYENWSTRGFWTMSLVGSVTSGIGDLKWNRKQAWGSHTAVGGITAWPYSASSISAIYSGIGSSRDSDRFVLTANTLSSTLTSSFVYQIEMAKVGSYADCHWIGGFVSDSVLSVKTDGIYFEGVNNGNVFATCRNANTETTVDTGVAVSAGFSVFSMTGSSTGIQFYINKVSKAAINTNIPDLTTPIYATFGAWGTASDGAWETKADVFGKIQIKKEGTGSITDSSNS